MNKRNIWGWPRGPPHYENGGLLPMDFMVYLFIRKEAARMNVMTMKELEAVIRALLRKYHAEYALLFGSYARGEATADSDIDVIVFGGKDFHPADIFAFGEELRQLTGKDVDAFEIREVDVGTPFYNAVMEEGVRIA